MQSVKNQTIHTFQTWKSNKCNISFQAFALLLVWNDLRFILTYPLSPLFNDVWTPPTIHTTGLHTCNSQLTEHSKIHHSYSNKYGTSVYIVRW